MTKRAEQAAKNRDRHPDIAAVVDELRAAFGDVRVVALREKG